MSGSDLFHTLRALLHPYEPKLIVKTDSDTNYYLDEALTSDKAQMFGAVQVKKRYTSFHLFPVYTKPSLLDQISPELRKRMQGKSCFNFNRVDQIPRAELEALVKQAFQSINT